MVKFTDDMKSTGFELIPEGVHVLRVREIKPVMNVGRVSKYTVSLEDSSGRIIFNSYDANPKAKYYKIAMSRFYSLLKTGCKLDEIDGEIDEQDAVGKYVIAKVSHTESDSGRTFQNLGIIFGNAEEGFATDISEYIERDNAYLAKKKAEAKDAPVYIEDDDDDPYA